MLYFFCLNITGPGFRFVPGDLGDARFNNYLLEHAHQYFTGEVNEYWNAPFMYPEEKVISYSDNLLGVAPFYSLFRLLGANRESAFQLWFMLICALNYAACYFLLKFLFNNNYAAALGAMLFAFSAALHMQIAHAQTFPRFAIPLTIWALLLYTKELRPSYFFLALLLLVYQFYCGIYLGFLLSVPVLSIFIYTFFYHRRTYRQKIRERPWILKTASALVAKALLILPLMLPYIERSKQTGFYPYENIVQSLPTPTSFLYSPHGTFFWDPLEYFGDHLPAFWDHKLFPGGAAYAGLLFFIGVGVARIWKKDAFERIISINDYRVLFVAAVCTFLLFIRFGDFSLYRLLYHIPGFGSLRALQRIINVEMIFFALGLGLLSAVLFSKTGRYSMIFFIAAVCLLVLDNYQNPEFIHRREVRESQQRVNAIIEKIKAGPDLSVISYEPDSINPTEMSFLHLDAMLAAQRLGKKSLNGYSATAPYMFDRYWIKPSELTRNDWMKTKGHAGEKVLVVR